jgi:hypothetical protein
MNCVITLGMVVIASVAADAQRRGGVTLTPPVIVRPGNRTTPGTPNPPQSPNGPGWGAGGRSLRHPFEPGSGRGSVPYLVPVPVYFGASDDQNMPPAGDEVESELLPQPQTPTVMAIPPAGQHPSTAIEQHTQNAAPAPSPEKVCSQPAQSDPVYLLIALKDGWVLTALAYWILGDTLHYLTPQGSHNQVSLELVNRKLSAKLNAMGAIELILP